MSQEMNRQMKESPKADISKMSSAENCATPSTGQLLPANCRLAQMPWLHKSYGLANKFSQSLIAKIIDRNDATKEKQNLFQALSKTIPFYLPASYHQMSCKRLKSTVSCNSSELLDMKQLWDDAFNFIYICNEFDHTYMANIISKVQNLETNFGSLLENDARAQYSNLEDNDHQISAVEFLLEPWILLQMPFQPALLHQWAATLLAEALIFQKKLSPLFSYGFPTKLKNIANDLRKMLIAMISCANYVLNLYLTMSTRGNELNIHATLYPEMEEFSNHIFKVLPILKFVAGKEASSIIEEILSTCLEELNAGGEVSDPQVIISPSDVQPTPIYDFWFWTKKCDLKKVFTGTKFDRNSEVMQHFLAFQRRCGVEENSALLIKLKRLVHRVFINSGRLSGVDPEIIMATIENFPPYLTNTYLYFVQHYCVIGLKNQGEFGLINNIIHLYGEAKTWETICVLTRNIFGNVKEELSGIKIFNPTEKNLSEESIPKINSQLNQILTNKEWSWDKVLADAKTSCGLSDVQGVSDVGMQTENLASYFQHRIKSLVYKISKRHLTTLNAGRFEFVPEHQFIQYVLPCFVLHFLGVCKNPSVSLTAKRKFMLFIDKLISSYEQQEYVQKLSTEKKSPIQNQRDAKICCESSNLSTFLLQLKKFINQEAAVKDIIFIFDCSLVKFMHGSNTANGLLIEGGPVKHSKWFLQIDMFLKRTISTLEDLNDIDQNKLLSITTNVERAISTSEKNVIAVSNLYIQSMLKAGGKNVASGISAIRKINAELGAGVPEDMLKSAHNLSCQQLAGLFVFLHFGNLETPQFLQWKNQFQGPGFPLDMCSVLIWCVATNDRWKIKQLVGPMLTTIGRRGKQSKDLSFATLDVVKSNLCYARVLEKISPDGTKVQMKQPGEITFVPIKHCRWCGLIKVEKFRLCPLCLECPEYCDVNYFCSDDCETVALDSKHREEHARYYLVELGIDRSF